MKIDKNSAFYIITAVLIIVLYLIFQPKVAVKLLGIRNPSLLNAFMQKTIKTKTIDVQQFWKMREFYCPGSFILDKTKNPFLIYSCRWLQSEDYLATSSALIKSDSSEQINILLQTPSILIYKTPQKLVVRFVVNGDEMKKAVGILDYAEKDKKLVTNKYWYDMTIIRL